MVRYSILFVFLLSSTSTLFSQQLPSPKTHFGFAIGDNYHLANFTQTESYFKKLAASDRVKLVDIGNTEEGRTQYMVIVSSPQNIQNLQRYKEISQRLARAENLTDEQAKALASQGKSVVWIDGGLHATETVGIHQLIETLWQLVSRSDAETLKILDETIVLFVHANPDGQELVSNWYMRNTDTLKRSLSQLPRLYQKYIGHDNNRDFYMLNMKESQNMSRQQYIEWMPQILYNHHQAGPQGSVVAGPPYRDPFNFVYDPILISSLDAVGAAMNNRLNVEGKPGYTSRSGSVYSTWWNGGLRTTAYFHNIVGLLTEIIGSPTPSTIPLVPARLVPNSATPNPVLPQRWLFRQSINYSVSLNYAVLDYASRNREHLLYNIYTMGKNAIALGNRDYWPLTPRHIDSVQALYKKEVRSVRSTTANTDDDQAVLPLRYYDSVFKNPSLRDARGYIIAADQPDFATAVKFINALVLSGVKVHKATEAFTVEGQRYSAGSYVVLTNQAFRPHVIDMFEPQDHPNDFQYPGGPPVRPYDAAGWTPAFSMGFSFTRVLNPFTGPFEAVPYGEVQELKQAFTATNGAAGYLLDSRSTNVFVLVNDLLKAGETVYRIAMPEKRLLVGQGSFYVPGTGKAIAMLNSQAGRLGIHPVLAGKMPEGATRVSALRIGLWDTYGGSMPSGWVRWMMEQYHFTFKQVYAAELNAGNLNDKYDVLVFVSGAIPASFSARQDTGRYPDDIPAEYRATMGRISGDKGLPALKKFVANGGQIVTIGSSTNLAFHFGLPVRPALVEMLGGKESALPGDKFYIPGSLLQVHLDSTRPATWGMLSKADVYFTSGREIGAGPVFKVAPDAIMQNKIVPLAWFGSGNVLRSGWAFGQAYLRDGITAFSAPMGKGTLYAFGPEITFRAQTYGTFKLLFNQLYGLANK